MQQLLGAQSQKSVQIAATRAFSVCPVKFYNFPEWTPNTIPLPTGKCIFRGLFLSLPSVQGRIEGGVFSNNARLDREGGISAGRGEAPEEFEPKFSPFPSLLLPPRAAMGIPRSLTMGIF